MAYRIHINLPRRFPPAARIPGKAELRQVLRRAVRAALEAEHVAAAEISLTLLDDRGIAELNGRYLDRAWPTDVIAFALHGAGEPPLGDVYIGWEQGLRQADEHGETGVAELARLAVHGTLHVLGHDHPEGEERTRSEMWRRQETIVRNVLDAGP